MRLLSNSLYTPASNFLIARARHSSKAKPDRAVPPQSKQRQARPAFVVVRPAWVLSLGLKSRTGPLGGTVSELQGVMW